MIPIKNQNPRRTLPVVTAFLIASNIYIFVKHNMSMTQHQLAALFSLYGTIPSRLLNPGDLDNFGSTLISLFTSMFLHGGLLHVAGNMLYLWIFGNNIEDYLGHARFFFFYIFCGLGAALTHIIISHYSNVPMVGASGAISGVLGAYLILFPRARILTIIPIFFFFKIAELPALLVLGLWFAAQFLNGYYSFQNTDLVNSGGVAWFSHVGGFLIGMAGILLFKKKKRV